MTKWKFFRRTASGVSNLRDHCIEGYNDNIQHCWRPICLLYSRKSYLNCHNESVVMLPEAFKSAAAALLPPVRSRSASRLFSDWSPCGTDEAIVRNWRIRVLGGSESGTREPSWRTQNMAGVSGKPFPGSNKVALYSPFLVDRVQRRNSYDGSGGEICRTCK